MYKHFLNFIVNFLSVSVNVLLLCAALLEHHFDRSGLERDVEDTACRLLDLK